VDASGGIEAKVDLGYVESVIRQRNGFGRDLQ
jgi:hypothetical protein